MLVLFTGGRGSGKSTIAYALYKKLNEENFDYVCQSNWRDQTKNIYEKIGWIVYFLTFFRPRICKVFLSRLYRDMRNGRAKGSFGRVYMPCVFSYHLHRLSQNKEVCVVYDSDFLTWAADKALDGVFNPSEVRDFYARVVLPFVGDVVVVVCDTPVQIAVERWRKRDKKTLSLYEVRQWVETRTAWKHARKKVVDVVSTVPGVSVVHLSGLDEPNKNAHQIMTALQK